MEEEKVKQQGIFFFFFFFKKKKSIVSTQHGLIRTIAIHCRQCLKNIFFKKKIIREIVMKFF